MPARQFSVRLDEPPALREGLRRLRSSLGIPGKYPAQALTEAEAAASEQTYLQIDGSGSAEPQNQRSGGRSVRRSGIADRAVEAAVKGTGLLLGDQVQATPVAADLLTGKVSFAAWS